MSEVLYLFFRENPIFSKVIKGIKSNEKLFFLVTVLLLLFVYLYHFTDIPFFRMDEGWVLQAPRMLAEEGRFGAPMLENGWNQTVRWYQHPPLYYLCLALFFKVFGFGILQVRVFPLIFAVCSGFVFLKILRFLELDRKINKFFAILLLFTSPLFFILAKTNRPEMMFLFLSLLSFYSLLRWMSDQKLFSLLVGALTFGLMCLTHYYVLYLFTLWIYVIAKKGKPRDILFFCAMNVVVFLPFAYWVSSDFKIFQDQVLMVLEKSGKFDVSSRISAVFKHLLLSKQAISITATLMIAVAIQLYYFKRNKDFTQKAMLLIPCLFIMQFLILPRVNYLYFVIVLPYIYMLFYEVIDQRNRKVIITILSVILAMNLFGLSFYVYKYKNYDYANYKKQFLDVVRFDPSTKILGRASLYPIFYNSQFRAYEAFEPNADWRERLIGVIEDVDYVIVDEFSRIRKCGEVILDEDIQNYIHKHMKLFATFTGKFYGSEGIKNNNLIEIYSKKVRN